MSNLLRKKGSVLVFSLIVLAIVLSSALSITAVNVSNRKSAASTAQSVQSFQTADTATEKVMKAIYNGNYASLTALYNALSAVQPTSTCPGVLNLAVAGGTAKVSFSDTNGAALTITDCSSVLWRDTLARVKIEGSGSTGGGAVRVIEVGIAPLSSMAWGENSYGQLGDGTGAERHSPVSTVGGSKWKSISAAGSSTTVNSVNVNGSHVLAVRSDGTLWAWGLNDHGQLGDGTVTNRSSPIQIGTDTDWESVATGEKHSLALKTVAAGGGLYVWGYNNHGQLGDNSTTERHAPAGIGSGCASISAGKDFSFTIKTNGDLYAWGQNDHGQLGDGTTNQRTTPVLIAGNWKFISAGDNHTLAINNNNRLYAWGAREFGELGDGFSSGDMSLPTNSIGTATWQSVSAGFNHSLGIQTDGTLWTWGRDLHGQLGRGSVGGADVTSPGQRDSGSTGWRLVSAGNAHSLAIRLNGTNRDLYAWGYDSNGQVGDGNIADRGTLYRILGNWQFVDGGSTFSIGVRR